MGKPLHLQADELADVALLGGDLASGRLDDDVLDLVEDRDRVVAEVGEHPPDLVRPAEHRMVGLNGQNRVFGEVREDGVDVVDAAAPGPAPRLLERGPEARVVGQGRVGREVGPRLFRPFQYTPS